MKTAPSGIYNAYESPSRAAFCGWPPRNTVSTVRVINIVLSSTLPTFECTPPATPKQWHDIPSGSLTPTNIKKTNRTVIAIAHEIAARRLSIQAPQISSVHGIIRSTPDMPSMSHCGLPRNTKDAISILSLSMILRVPETRRPTPIRNTALREPYANNNLPLVKNNFTL